ncbi:hypothetical protein RFI_10838 [Reticulomyxa filosa]|uniref:Pentacotripeptide-repeat region of PRORP domain-containing protein n=1 Tax=Reticulomyxa filosa TaxID=46433 RepID=X6NK67_RETFI|nr:hypothetical protein RFI_10838 [Reticulomyxa filosa]|eukprot:ETO26303.1 hypothetical protein RFI_10838 [Reticulomyxa filosa]
MQHHVVKKIFLQRNLESKLCKNVIRRLYHVPLKFVQNQKDIFVKQIKDDAASRKRMRGVNGALTKAEIPQHMKEKVDDMRYMEKDSIFNFLKDPSNWNVILYSAAVKLLFERHNSWRDVLEVVELAEEYKVQLNVIFCASVLNFWAMCDRHSLADQYFEKWFENECETMREKPNVILFTAMIKAHKERGNVEKALKYFNMMQDKFGIAPDGVCYSLLLTVCANACQVETAEKLIQNRDQRLIRADSPELLGAMLNVYGKAGELDKMMNIWNTMEKQLQTSTDVYNSLEVWTTIVMASLLQANKVQEMFDFYYKRVCKLAKYGRININDQKIIVFQCIGYIRMMELAENEKERQQHFQSFLHIFLNELSPLFPIELPNFRTVPLKEMDLLLQAFILLHKDDWLKAVPKFEFLWSTPQCRHSLPIWVAHPFISGAVLDFHLMSHISTTFILRYLVTFQRHALSKYFHNGIISIICGKGTHSRIDKSANANQSRQSQRIQHELNNWVVPVRFVQHARDPSVWYIDPTDLAAFFKKVPPYQSCLKT